MFLLFWDLWRIELWCVSLIQMLWVRHNVRMRAGVGTKVEWKWKRPNEDLHCRLRKELYSIDYTPYCTNINSLWQTSLLVSSSDWHLDLFLSICQAQKMKTKTETAMLSTAVADTFLRFSLIPSHIVPAGAPKERSPLLRSVRSSLFHLHYVRCNIVHTWTSYSLLKCKGINSRGQLIACGRYK